MRVNYHVSDRKRIAVQLGLEMDFFKQNPECWELFTSFMNRTQKIKSIIRAINEGITKSDDFGEAVKEYACFGCPEEKQCPVSWDEYNLHEEYPFCLWTK